MLHLDYALLENDQTQQPFIRLRLSPYAPVDRNCRQDGRLCCHNLIAVLWNECVMQFYMIWCEFITLWERFYYLFGLTGSSPSSCAVFCFPIKGEYCLSQFVLHPGSCLIQNNVLYFAILSNSFFPFVCNSPLYKFWDIRTLKAWFLNYTKVLMTQAGWNPKWPSFWSDSQKEHNSLPISCPNVKISHFWVALKSLAAFYPFLFFLA